MKKIVGILAAAAVMATSVFAADVSAAIQGYGDLFSFSTAKGSHVNVLGWNDPWDRQFSWYSTGIGFTANANKAGLSFELDGNNKAIDKDGNTTTRIINVKNSTFWIQPLDMLKIKLGANTIELAKETIDYAGTVFTTSFEGWAFELKPMDGLTVQLGLNTAAPTGWSTNYWYGSKNYDGGDSMGEVVASVAYGADFGTITAIYDLNNKKNTIGVDYVGNFGATMVSPAVAFVVEDKALAADVYVTTNIDAIGINLYAKADVPVENAGNTAVAVNTKFSMGTGIGMASLQVKDDNVLAKNFAMMVKANLNFNCGSAGMDVGVQLDVADTVKVSVPFQYNLHF